MDVKTILIEYLRERKFEGLFNRSAMCKCKIDNLMAHCKGANASKCCPGYIIEQVDRVGIYTYYICPEDHIKHENCNCVYCRMLFISSNHYAETKWEKKFIKDLINKRREVNFTLKQRDKIKQIFYAISEKDALRL